MLNENQANLVLKAYVDFCQSFYTYGKITDRNLEYLKIIDKCIGSKTEFVQGRLGRVFGEIYALLDNPEIKIVLKNGLHRIEQHQQKTYNKKAQKFIEDDIWGNFAEDVLSHLNDLDEPKNEGDSKTSKHISRKKSKSAKVKPNKQKDNQNIEEAIRRQKLEELREIFLASVIRAKQEEKENISNINYGIISDIPIFSQGDDRSTFKDIMDEVRAEGKGYGGSK
ncbi:MAG: hypothetical protein WCP16_13215 [Pseudanabaena sp. ELA645]|jgi:hypothetical protein